MAKKKQTTGNCKYCGQSMIIHLPEGWDPEDKAQEDYDQLATEQCECERALSAEEKNQRKTAAVKRMTEHYDTILDGIKPTTPELQEERKKVEGQQELMIKTVEMVADGHVVAAQVQISLSQMFTVTVKKNGDLQIKRVYKGVEEWLF